MKCPLSLLVLALSVLMSGHSTGQDIRFSDGTNLIQNGSFEVAGGKGFAKDWGASGPATSARLNSAEAQHGETCQEIHST